MTEESFILESEGIVLRFFVAYAPQNDKVKQPTAVIQSDSDESYCKVSVPLR